MSIPGLAVTLSGEEGLLFAVVNDCVLAILPVCFFAISISDQNDVLHFCVVAYGQAQKD